MQSIVRGEREDKCIWCGRSGVLHKHHIFGGANRKWSEKYGLYVHLCPEHHNMSDSGVHFNKEMMGYFHRLGQDSFEEWYCQEHKAPRDKARAEFMKIFGRNYLY